MAKLLCNLGILLVLANSIIAESLNVEISTNGTKNDTTKGKKEDDFFSLKDLLEFSIPSPSECDLRLWVRSEDLRPSTVIEGDVRLLNNLTSRSVEDCGVTSWSLGLRLRERGAFQYLVARPARPIPPVGLNLTQQVDDEENVDLGFESGQMSFGGIKETVRDEAKELRKKWDLDLEKWVEDVRLWEDEKAYHALEKHVTVFESLMEMGEPKHSLLDNTPTQHHISSFGVAIPSTNYRAGTISRGSSFRGGLAVETSSSYDMSYFARVNLGNGSTIEIYGGSANFLPLPQSHNGLSLASNESFNLPITSGKYHLMSMGGEYFLDDCKLEESSEDLMMQLDLPFEGNFVQGRNYTLNGKIFVPKALTEAQVPVSLSLYLATKGSSRWSIDTITEKVKSNEMLDIDVDQTYSGRHSNSSEMLQGAIRAVRTHSSSSWIQKISPLQLHDLLLNGKKKSNDEEERRFFSWERDPYEMAEGTLRLHDFEKEVKHQLQSNSTADSYHFQIHLSIPNSTFPTSSSSFEDITSHLKFELKTVKRDDLACLHLDVLKEKRIKPSLAEVLNCKSSPADQNSEVNHELANWVTDEHRLKESSELWTKVFQHQHQHKRSWVKSGDERLGKQFFNKNVDVEIIPKIWEQPKRSKELEGKLLESGISEKKHSPFHYYQEPDHARAPILLQGSEDSLLKAVDIVAEESQLHDLIRSSSSADIVNVSSSPFPLISNISSFNLTHHWNGIQKYKKKEVFRKLGSEHLIPPKETSMGFEDDFFDSESGKRFYVARNSVGPPNSWSYPAWRGSATLEIGRVWNENVMIKMES